MQKREPTAVYIEVQKHDIVVANRETLDIVIRRPIEKIDFYRYASFSFAARCHFWSSPDVQIRSCCEAALPCHGVHKDRPHDPHLRFGLFRSLLLSACIFFLSSLSFHGSTWWQVAQAQEGVENAFVVFHRGIQKWSRTSLRESDAARRRAMQQLMSQEHSVENGAFVLRDSTSRPGSYGAAALSRLTPSAVGQVRRQDLAHSH